MEHIFPQLLTCCQVMYKEGLGCYTKISSRIHEKERYRNLYIVLTELSVLRQHTSRIN
jgi:hypothetical protein